VTLDKIKNLKKIINLKEIEIELKELEIKGDFTR